MNAHRQKMYLLWLLTATCALTFTGFAGEKGPAANTYVKCTVDASHTSIKPGETGVMFVSLKPAKGIHINITPAMGVVFDSAGQVQAGGAMEIPKKETFLDASKPVRIPFVLSTSAKPGTVTVKAALTYYYCSDAEGWCSRYKQPLEVTIKVAK